MKILYICIFTLQWLDLHLRNNDCTAVFKFVNLWATKTCSVLRFRLWNSNGECPGTTWLNDVCHAVKYAHVSLPPWELGTRAPLTLSAEVTHIFSSQQPDHWIQSPAGLECSDYINSTNRMNWMTWYPAVHGTRRFLTVFTSASYWTLPAVTKQHPSWEANSRSAAQKFHIL